ncbi:hypothetical protein EYC80_003557 [Monilinia laxa]|uniref:Uncharacterized protein n=1 Tax=Monilinia laxa TaxID=61186 RepID=A0A5N6KKC5_MONLA|nr:hypothetical protein EYC80_003557 [Monilinia laxa]
MAANNALVNFTTSGLSLLLTPSLLGPTLDTYEEFDFETAHEELQSLMAGMDPDSFNEMTELLSVRQEVLESWEYMQTLLKIARAKSTKWFHAPNMPITDESLLAPLSCGLDVYQQIQFTAISGVLAAEAKFFKPLCDNRWKCGRTGVIELENYQPETFAIFITWLYTRDHTNAEGLVKIYHHGHAYSNFRTRKSSHKKRWFQLLHCYFLADYISAPQFANHIMDALIFAFKDWVEEDSFYKVCEEPIFEDRETEEMVRENTADSSPLRLLVNDILSPFLVLREAGLSTSFLRRFHLPAKLRNHHPPISPPQDSPFPIPSNQAHSNNGNILNSMYAPNTFADLPQKHPVPFHLQIPPPQYDALDPAFIETNYLPSRSRFNVKFHRETAAEQLAMNLMKSENFKKIWGGSRCKYHIHEEGKDCSSDVVSGIS